MATMAAARSVFRSSVRSVAAQFGSAAKSSSTRSSFRTPSAKKLRQLAWSGVPSDMRPNVWRLLLGYAPPNSDIREGVLRRKRLEYLDCVAQYYDIPDTERSDDEINMRRQNELLNNQISLHFSYVCTVARLILNACLLLTRLSLTVQEPCLILHFFSNLPFRNRWSVYSTRGLQEQLVFGRNNKLMPS